MPDKALGWLVEIEDAIKRIRSYTSGCSKAEFLADEKTSDATAPQLMIIGEAARKLPHDIRKEAPEVPWPNIRSSRYGTASFTVIEPSIVVSSGRSSNCAWVSWKRRSGACWQRAANEAPL